MSSESAEVLSQTISRFSVEETEELVDLIGNFKAIIFLLIELLQLYNSFINKKPKISIDLKVLLINILFLDINKTLLINY